jgi:uncharacterized alkaline shock family protein YloU
MTSPTITNERIPASSAAAPADLAPLTSHDEEGTTVIDDVVVAKIAAAAAQEVGGIHGFGATGIGGRVSGAFGAVTGAVSGTTGGASSPSTQGVTVEVGSHEALVSLNIIIDYGARIPQVITALRKNIADRVQTLTGLTVKAINVEVSDVAFPEEQTASPTALS